MTARWFFALAVLAVGSLVASPAGADRLRVLVFDAEAVGEVGVLNVAALNRAFLAQASTLEGFEFVGLEDVRALVGVEAERQALGCSRERCMVELASAIEADRLVRGSISRVGDLYLVTYRAIDTHSLKTVSQLTKSVAAGKTAPEQVLAVVSEAPALLFTDPLVALRARAVKVALERRTAAPPPVSVPEASHAPKLSRPLVEKVLRPWRQSAPACYASGVGEAIGIEGRLELEIAINEQGRVTGCALAETTMAFAAEVSACLCAGTAALEFPMAAPSLQSVAFLFLGPEAR